MVRGMVRRVIEGPCAFCGAPAETRRRVQLRARPRPRKPVWVRMCRKCERTEFKRGMLTRQGELGFLDEAEVAALMQGYGDGGD